MTDKTLRLSFYNLITAIDTDPTEEISHFFQKYLSDFIVEEENFSNQQVDLVFISTSNQHPIVLQAVDIEARDGILILEYESYPVIYFYYRNKVDFAVVFEDKQIKLFYLSLNKFSQRIANVMNYCIRHLLAQRQQFLSQGVVLTKQNRSVWLIGPRLARKTMIMLFLLNKGWNFISDDKFILAHQKAYLWDKNIFLRGHHLGFFSGLASRVNASNKIESKVKTRNQLLKLSQQFLPKYLHPLVERFVPKEFYSVNIKKAFPEAEIITESNLTDVIILAIGSKVEIKEIDFLNAVDDLAIIQQIFLKKTAALETALVLAYPHLKINYAEILQENLKNVRCYKLTAPIMADFSEIEQELEKLLGEKKAT